MATLSITDRWRSAGTLPCGKRHPDMPHRGCRLPEHPDNWHEVLTFNPVMVHRWVDGPAYRLIWRDRLARRLAVAALRLASRPYRSIVGDVHWPR